MSFLDAGKQRDRGFYVVFFDDPVEDPRPRFVDLPAGGRAVLFDRDEGMAMLQMVSEATGIRITIEEDAGWG